MSLTLRYHAKTSVPVEIEGVVPDRLRDKSLAEIERIEASTTATASCRWPSCSASPAIHPTGGSTSRAIWPASTSSATG